jgi:hypothetical protein
MYVRLRMISAKRHTSMRLEKEGFSCQGDGELVETDMMELEVSQLC